MAGSINRPFARSNEKVFTPKSNGSSNGLRRQGRTVTTTPPPAGQTQREVDFVLERNGAEQVYVCGDFNGWRPAGLRMIGRYEYKFVVDGQWMHDPDARESVPNIHGSLNSVVEVGP